MESFNPDEMYQLAAPSTSLNINAQPCYYLVPCPSYPPNQVEGSFLPVNNMEGNFLPTISENVYVYDQSAFAMPVLSSDTISENVYVYDQPAFSMPVLSSDTMSEIDCVYDSSMPVLSSDTMTVGPPDILPMSSDTMTVGPPDIMPMSSDTMTVGPPDILPMSSDTMAVGRPDILPMISDPMVVLPLDTLSISCDPLVVGPLDTLSISCDILKGTIKELTPKLTEVDLHDLVTAMDVDPVIVGDSPIAQCIETNKVQLTHDPSDVSDAGDDESQSQFKNIAESVDVTEDVPISQLLQDPLNLYEDVSDAGDDDNQSQLLNTTSVGAYLPRNLMSQKSQKLYFKELYITRTMHSLRTLMHAFGDVNEPLDKSALLIDNILKSQIILLISYCKDLVIKFRKPKEITHEIMLFLMRKNKALLRRLLQWLYIKDCGRHILPGFVEYRGTKIIPDESTTVCLCLEYLCSIEKFTGELSSLFCNKKVFDCVLENRLERRFLMENLRDEAVRDGFKSTLEKNISFSHYVEKFRMLDSLHITPIAALIIEFLVFETVAALVEKALFLRTRKYKEKPKVFPAFVFGSSTVESEETNDDLLEDDAASPDVRFSFIPRKYLKDKNSLENNEKKISNDETFYEDSALTVLPKVVLFHNNSKPNYLPEHFLQQDRNSGLKILMKKASEKVLIPKNPITPNEIRAAFTHYQRPSPMSMFMVPKPPYSEKRKIKLISLALPKEEYEEAT